MYQGESPEFDLASHSLPIPTIPLYFNASLYSASFYTLRNIRKPELPIQKNPFKSDIFPCDFPYLHNTKSLQCYVINYNRFFPLSVDIINKSLKTNWLRIVIKFCF